MKHTPAFGPTVADLSTSDATPFAIGVFFALLGFYAFLTCVMEWIKTLRVFTGHGFESNITFALPPLPSLPRRQPRVKQSPVLSFDEFEALLWTHPGRVFEWAAREKN